MVCIWRLSSLWGLPDVSHPVTTHIVIRVHCSTWSVPLLCISVAILDFSAVSGLFIMAMESRCDICKLYKKDSPLLQRWGSWRHMNVTDRETGWRDTICLCGVCSRMEWRDWSKLEPYTASPKEHDDSCHAFAVALVRKYK